MATTTFPYRLLSVVSLFFTLSFIPKAAGATFKFATTDFGVLGNGQVVELQGLEPDEETSSIDPAFQILPSTPSMLGFFPLSDGGGVALVAVASRTDAKRRAGFVRIGANGKLSGPGSFPAGGGIKSVGYGRT